jgi:hypothetical protein
MFMRKEEKDVEMWNRQVAFACHLLMTACVGAANVACGDSPLVRGLSLLGAVLLSSACSFDVAELIILSRHRCEDEAPSP